MEENPKIREFLESAGYKLRHEGNNFRTAALYREGKNGTSLLVNKFDGNYYDFGIAHGGTFEELSKLINGEAIVLNNSEKVRVVDKYKVKKKYDPAILDHLLPHFDFFINRGLSENTLKTFNVGFAMSGKLRNRYVWPIREKNGDIIGFSGRYYKEVPPIINGEQVAKWKHENKSANFLWGLNINDGLIREKGELALTESIGDAAALWEIGYKTVLPLFGLKMSGRVLSYIAGIYPLKRIIIATNNDENRAGNNAADNIRAKLKNLIDEDKILVKLPESKYNDWGKMLQQNKELLIKTWF